MIRGMLEKLKDKQSEETKKSAWCKKEMAGTLKEQTRRVQDVQTHKDRLQALEADLTETKSDIETTGKDLTAMQKSMAEAVKVRQQEQAQAEKSMKTYHNAAKLLRHAMNVLKGYYDKKTEPLPKGGIRDTSAAADDDQQRKGLGTGIIGILEIAVEDFEQLHDETKDAEELAARDFKDEQEQNMIRKAVFEKDVEFKGRMKTKLESDEATMKNDLKSYESELQATNNYLDKLKASCIIKGPTYEERKARRAETIKAVLSLAVSEARAEEAELQNRLSSKR